VEISKLNGYHGLEENGYNIDASVHGYIKKILIFFAEFFWAVLSLVGVSDMVKKMYLNNLNDQI
jgi:hypothetical protein